MLHYKLGEILIREEEIERKVNEIAGLITEEYRGQQVIVIGVLRGAVIFMSDLVRKIGDAVDVRIDFMSVSSYGAATESSGVVKINKDLDSDIEGKHVILVEDIVDSGLTLHYLNLLLRNRKPASLRLCALLDKPERRKVDLKVDYTGFSIPDEFVVGYGLDCDSKWRQMSDIYIVKTE